MIELDNLVKEYTRENPEGKVITNRAVDGFSFSVKDGEPRMLRFVFQYHSDDWLFIENMIFNIDGENITIIPDMETDCGNGGKIWEWCDEAVVGGNCEYSVKEKLIAKIANAKSVKVKLNGSQYYDTRTLTAEQIKSIRDTYEYYKALGAKLSST